MLRTARMLSTARSIFLLSAFALTACPTPAFSVPSFALAQDQAASAPDRADSSKKSKEDPLPSNQVHNPILWQQPENIANRDLFYGQGGEKHTPKPPFTFVSEDTDGTNPKFDVRDANNKKWRVKIGEEARPEVVASRLLWAVGYFANDDYLLHEATVQGIHMKRGKDKVRMLGDSGQVVDVRFSRKPGGQDKIAIWQWKDNPFTGTPEFDGLRVMMAVMNNWDLKDVNNAVYTDKDSDRQIFLVNDVGASFGSNGISWTRARSKGNIDSFKGSKFIQSQTDTTVSFATPHAPTGIVIATLGATSKQYAMRSGLDWIGNDIPKEHARWMGKLLSQLTHQQLVDAFRAGNFPADQIEAYVDIVESRIAELKQL